MQTKNETADLTANQVGGPAAAPEHPYAAYHDCPWPVYAASGERVGAVMDKLIRASGTTGLLTWPYTWLDGRESEWWCAYWRGRPVGLLYETRYQAMFVLALEAMRHAR